MTQCSPEKTVSLNSGMARMFHLPLFLTRYVPASAGCKPSGREQSGHEQSGYEPSGCNPSGCASLDYWPSCYTFSGYGFSGHAPSGCSRRCVENSFDDGSFDDGSFHEGAFVESTFDRRLQAGRRAPEKFRARNFTVQKLAAAKFALWTLLAMALILSIPAKGNAAPPKRFEIQTFSLATTGNMLTLNLALNVDDEEGLYNLLKDGAVVELGIDIQVERKRDWWSNATIASLRYTSVIRHDPLTREFFLTMPSVPPTGIQGSMPERAQEDTAQTPPTTSPKTVPGTLPGTVPGTLPDNVPQSSGDPEFPGGDIHADKPARAPSKPLTLKDRNLTRLLTNSWQKLHLPLIPLSLIELEGHNQTYVVSGSASLNHIETPPWLAKNSVFWSAEIIPPVTFSLEYFYQ